MDSERELILHMNGGKGEKSYANNSSLQVKYHLFIILIYINITRLNYITYTIIKEAFGNI